jgi:hypothetical protein
LATAEQLAELRSRKKTPGRPPGASNKITKDLKKAYLGAFDALGGMEGLINWGKKQPDLFYTQISKLLPKGVEIKTDQELTINIISHIAEPLPLEAIDIQEVKEIEDKSGAEDAPQSTNSGAAIP